MQNKSNKSLIPLAKELRKNMTKEEKKLWYDFLRNHPVRFSRQKILGKYIVDFYSAALKLVIEIDGLQHDSEEGILYDAERTAFLEGYGLTVIRIKNSSVNNNFSKVCKYIEEIITQKQNSLMRNTP